MTVFENLYTIITTMFFPASWESITNYEELLSLVVFVLTALIGYVILVKPFVWLIKLIGRGNRARGHSD